MNQDLRKKIAELIELSFDVTDKEKETAALASEQLNIVLQYLDAAVDNLDVLYTPLKPNPEVVPVKDVLKYRGNLMNYKNSIIQKFDIVKIEAMKAITLLNAFAKDSSILELINSFKDEIEELDQNLNDLAEGLGNYKSPEFGKTFIDVVDKIKKNVEDLERFVNERIIAHLNENILVKNWTAHFENKKDKAQQNQTQQEIK